MGESSVDTVTVALQALCTLICLSLSFQNQCHIRSCLPLAWPPLPFFLLFFPSFCKLVNPSSLQLCAQQTLSLSNPRGRAGRPPSLHPSIKNMTLTSP